MKQMIITILMLCSIAAWALPEKAPSPEKLMSVKEVDNGRLSFEIDNLGMIRNLIYQNQHKMIYSSGTWISGKRYRRDSANRLLYWAEYPPTSNTALLYEGHPDWTPTLVAAQDTLTSVAFDGDRDLYELLPAYNPLVLANPTISPLFEFYNNQDRVLESIAGEPAPLAFNPFDPGNFCFSIPQPGTLDTPGFQTYSSYYYDYCPFGSPGDRDLGYSRAQSTHYPLGIAVHQESYCWPVQDHDWMLVSKYNIYNTSALDTIRDLAISHYVDADVGPASWGVELAADDKSGYVTGDGYEFAYTFDADGDGGLSPYYLASKVIIPEFIAANYHAWYWRVGQGPDDRNPRNLLPTPNKTSNQKYWLATGRNPDTASYTPLRPEDPDVMQYEQPMPNDTRFLNCLFGAQPGTSCYWETDADGNYWKRLDLGPQQSISYYKVLFIGDSLDDLKAKSLAIEAFLANDLIIDPNAGYTSFPYLREPVAQAPDTFALRWHNATPPADYELYWKEYGAPASQWYVIPLSGSTNSYNLQGMNPDTWYEIKVGAIFYNPAEVYLESDTKLVNLSYSGNADDNLLPVPRISIYPNPFSQGTTIEFDAKQTGRQQLSIYNLKGQLVRSLEHSVGSPGLQQLRWDGKDSSGKACSNGIYYLRMQNDKQVQVQKMLLLK